MKKGILLVMATVLVAMGANAQNFGKGDRFLGARSTGLGFSHAFGNNVPSDTNINLDGYGGWFLSDKFAVDALLGFNINKVSDLNSSASYNLGVGVRYYPVGNLFARVGYNALIRNNDDTGLISDATATVGYDLFLNDNIYFEPAVFYQKNIANDGGKNTLGLSLGLGIKF
jgi:opacity protein-like surface antigen